MLRFRQMKSLQKCASVHANVHYHFNLDRHLSDRQTYKAARSAALAEWQNLISLNSHRVRDSRPNRRRVAIRLTAPSFEVMNFISGFT